MSAEVHVCCHPLLLHRLALLRDRTTPTPAFRRLVREMAQLLFIEATRDLTLDDWTVQTPLEVCAGQRLTEAVGLAPILRAGLGMAEAIHELVPDAPVWHLGVYRDHDTSLPVTYYHKLPARPNVARGFVLDPMLATGGSAIAAVEILQHWGLRRLSFLSLIAAPEGVAALHAAHPEVPIYLAALDRQLDAHKYIVPGLGDAGDRQFGTG
jgi:uracil phosphoribosyltransferase